MANTFRHRRGAAILNFELCRRQVRLAVSGPITPSVLVSIGRDLDRIGTQSLARSFVVDLRPSVVAVSYDQILAGPDNISPTIRALPLAVIPPAASVEVFHDFAWEMARLGLLRGTFADPARAQEWAGRKEALCFRTPVSAR
jgi:hypothetical protein